MRFWRWFALFTVAVVVQLAMTAVAFLFDTGAGVLTLLACTPGLIVGVYFMWDSYKCARGGIFAC
jgi:hypothetical protein